MAWSQVTHSVVVCWVTFGSTSHHWFTGSLLVHKVIFVTAMHFWTNKALLFQLEYVALGIWHGHRGLIVLLCVGSLLVQQVTIGSHDHYWFTKSHLFQRSTFGPTRHFCSNLSMSP